MKKILIMVVVLAVFGVLMVAKVDAAQWCWQITETSAFVKLSAIKPDPSYFFWSVNGIWYYPGSYILPLAGTMVKSADGSQRILGLLATLYHGTQFYAIHGEIDAISKNGTFYLYNFYQALDIVFSMTKVNCGTLPAP